MSDIIQNDLIREKSCGAVIYTESSGRRVYLIELMQKGHFSMCKGDETRRTAYCIYGSFTFPGKPVP